MSNTNKNRVRACQAFTLVELLVVIAIISLLAGLAFPAVNGQIERTKRRRAQTDVVIICNAMKGYRAYYGKWPGQTSSHIDYTYDGASRHQLPLFQAMTNNPKQEIFLELPPNILDSNGNYMDPWGNPYVITLDESEDGTNLIQGLNWAVKDIVSVYSKGLDPTDTNKWIRSWDM